MCRADNKMNKEITIKMTLEEAKIIHHLLKQAKTTKILQVITKLKVAIIINTPCDKPGNWFCCTGELKPKETCTICNEDYPG